VFENKNIRDLVSANRHKKRFSAKELQRQLGHNRYHPIWHMTHKLRDTMGKRNTEYV